MPNRHRNRFHVFRRRWEHSFAAKTRDEIFEEESASLIIEHSLYEIFTSQSNRKRERERERDSLGPHRAPGDARDR